MRIFLVFATHTARPLYIFRLREIVFAHIANRVL